ncbi:MAG TPA: TVP38/TMEM64 family protein [Gemmataceae bacterium]|nr:TVP38/TMEM64 family protein [Gemmataceae bacterium]
MVLAGVLLLAIVGFFALGWHHYFSWDSIRANLDSFKAEVEDHWLLSLLVFFVVYAAITALSIPVAAIMTLLGGALFDRVIGTILISLAATVGAVLAFWSSRYLFHDLVQKRFRSRLEAFNRGFEKDGGYYLFTLRLVPIFPFFLINLGMGLTTIRTWTYTWISWVGMLPGTLLYVNAGRELGTLESPGDILSPGVLISLILLGVAPLVFRKLVKRERAP